MITESGCPSYTIRRSRRARRVLLRLSHEGELVVVLPTGYSARKVPAVLEKHRDWVEKAFARMAPHLERRAAEPMLPEEIHLPLWGRWRVTYSDDGRSGARELAPGVLRVGPGGVVERRKFLGRWLARQGKALLPPLVETLGCEGGFHHREVVVRNQKSRWGSCSSRGEISLNRKLMFLPEELVRYVIFHELAHTVHLNHSAAFWELVGEHCPEHRRHAAVLRGEGWARVPRWAL